MLRDYKISIIRILAMTSIVLCHIFQALDMQLAHWLNVGVQVFLFMSGYLYGQKNIKNNKEWIIKQLKKIFIPYYIYVFIIFIIYFIFERNLLTWENIESLFLLKTIFSLPKGLGHLWFITIIFICYLITPLLQKIVKSDIYSNKKKILLIFIIIILFESMFFQDYIYPDICNIICYILGYIIAYEKEKGKNKIFEYSIIVMALISNIIKVTGLSQINVKVIDSILNILVLNSHILLGSAIFIIFYKLFKNINILLNETRKKYIDIVDKYSYYIYITHHVFILGPFSLISLTPKLLINLLIIIACIIISSYILKSITDLIIKIINKKNLVKGV